MNIIKKMNKNKVAYINGLLICLFILSTILIVGPSIVHGAGAGAYTQEIPSIKPQPPISVITVLQRFGGYFLTISGVLAVVMIIVGGIRFITSAGSPTQTEGAKKTIMYAIIGLVIIVLSGAIYQVVKTVVLKATPPPTHAPPPTTPTTPPTTP